MESILAPDEIRELENQPGESEQHTRFQLWSIIEIMERFYASSFMCAISNLELLRTGLLYLDYKYEPLDHKKLLTDFKEVIKGLKEIRLSRVIHGQISSIEPLISQQADVRSLNTAIIILKQSILDELTSSWFLRIEEDKRQYYEQKLPLFGQEVDKVFYTANPDISASGRCLALGEWTACVFHLMRVLERGLRELAKQLHLEEKKLDNENWKTIIDRIECKIHELRNVERKDKDHIAIQFYSEVATSFIHYKDAWRNHVSHSRASYDERQAVVIYNNIKAFMQSLAKQQVS